MAGRRRGTVNTFDIDFSFVGSSPQSYTPLTTTTAAAATDSTIRGFDEKIDELIHRRRDTIQSHFPGLDGVLADTKHDVSPPPPSAGGAASSAHEYQDTPPPFSSDTRTGGAAAASASAVATKPDTPLDRFVKKAFEMDSSHDFTSSESRTHTQASHERRSSASLLTPMRDSRSDTLRVMADFSDRNDLYFHLREAKNATVQGSPGIGHAMTTATSTSYLSSEIAGGGGSSAISSSSFIGDPSASSSSLSSAKSPLTTTMVEHMFYENIDGGLVSSNLFLPLKQHCEATIGELALELDEILTARDRGERLTRVRRDISQVRKIRRHIYNVEHQFNEFIDGVKQRQIDLSEMQTELRAKQKKINALSKQILNAEAEIIFECFAPILSERLEKMDRVKKRHGIAHETYQEMESFVRSLEEEITSVRTVSDEVLTEDAQIEKSYQGLSRQLQALKRQAARATEVATTELTTIQDHYGLPKFFTSARDYYSLNRAIITAVSEYTRTDKLSTATYYNSVLNVCQLQTLLTAPATFVLPKSSSSSSSSSSSAAAGKAGGGGTAGVGRPKTGAQNWEFVREFIELFCVTLLDCEMVYSFVSSHVKAAKTSSIVPKAEASLMDEDLFLTQFLSGAVEDTGVRRPVDSSATGGGSDSQIPSASSSTSPLKTRVVKKDKPSSSSDPSSVVELEGLHDSPGIVMAQSLSSRFCRQGGMDVARPNGKVRPYNEDTSVDPSEAAIYAPHPHRCFPEKLWEVIAILAEVCRVIPESQFENVVSNLAVSIAANYAECKIREMDGKSQIFEDAQGFDALSTFSKVMPESLEAKSVVRMLLSTMVCDPRIPHMIQVISAVKEEDSYAIASQIMYSVFGVADLH